MIAGSEHESEGGSKEPIRLEDFVSRPEQAEAVDLNNPQKVLPQNSNRWKTPLEIGLVLALAAGVGGAVIKMNQDTQAQKDAQFGKALATATAESYQTSARATEFVTVPFPTATKEATATTIATVQPSPTEVKPTATPTPEVVYETPDIISKEQKEQMAQDKYSPLDTWSEQGGTAVFSPGASGLNMLGVNKLEEGDVYSSPLPGKIKSVKTFILQFPKKAKLMIMEVELTPSRNMNVYFYPDQEVLKSEGEILSNTPLFKIKDTDYLPAFSAKTKLAQVYMEVVDAQTGKPVNLTPEDVLKDSQGKTIQAISK